MTPSALRQQLQITSLGIALLLGANAQAGYVQAVAEEGSFAAVQAQNAGVLASAVAPNNVAGGGASSSATRLQLRAASDGAGAGPTGQYFHAARASNFTEYRLWDIDNNVALATADAQRLNLSFNFRLLSALNVPVGGVGLDIGTLSYAAQVVSLNSAFIDDHHDAVAYAVGPPDSHTGNLALIGAVNLAFSLLHDNSDSGWLSMDLGNSGSNDVTARGQLSLLSIDVSEDLLVNNSGGRGAAALTLGSASTDAVLGGRNIGVRFDSGEVYGLGRSLLPGTSGVPEPASWALVLSALALVPSAARRGKGASTAGKDTGAHSVA